MNELSIAALGLWLKSQLSEGNFSLEDVLRWGGEKKSADELVSAGYWRRFPNSTFNNIFFITNHIYNIEKKNLYIRQKKALREADSYLDTQITELQEFWKTIMKKPSSGVSDFKLLKRVLRTGSTPASIKLAIVGCSLSEKAMGNGPSGKSFNNLHHILREDAMVRHVQRAVRDKDLLIQRIKEKYASGEDTSAWADLVFDTLADASTS